MVTKVHFIKWISWRAETHGCRMISLGCLLHLVDAFPIALQKVLSQFPCFSSYLSIFFSIASVILYIHHMSCFFFLFLCHCFNYLSPLHLSLMLNVIPPFFRLWFRWHLPRVAVIAKCRLGRWDIGQPLPSPSTPLSLLLSMSIQQFVLNACWVL